MYLCDLKKIYYFNDIKMVEKLLLDGNSSVLTSEGYRELRDISGTKISVFGYEGFFENVEIKSFTGKCEGSFYKLKTKLDREIVICKKQPLLKRVFDKEQNKFIAVSAFVTDFLKDKNLKLPKVEPCCIHSDLRYDEDSYNEGFYSKKKHKRMESSPFLKTLFSVSDRILWLEGVLASSGNLMSRVEGKKVYCTILLTGEESFLKGVIRVLSTLGVHSRLRGNKRSIIISHHYILKLNMLGFRWRGEVLDIDESVGNRVEYDSVDCVVNDTGGCDDKYYIEPCDVQSTYILVNDIPVKVIKN